MEPRPQQPRPSGQRNPPPGQTPAGGSPPQQPPYQPLPGQELHHEGYPEGYDPTTVVAPPRTDYDYSPLDLAPPGQRRRRQLIAGAIGALSIILIGALIVFGWMLLRDESPDDDPENRVAITTQSPGDKDAAGAGDGAAGTPPPATVAPTENVAPTQPVATNAPTVPPAGSVATDVAGLTAMLPDSSTLPAGFDEGVDSTRDQAGVLQALGGSRIAEQNLAAWGWTANVERVFTNPTAEAGATSNITVSLHGFKDAPSTAEALTFYSDILLNLGYYEVDPPQLGENARMLRQDGQDGGVTVALYVQKGPVLYRFGGYAMGGDPTLDVINIAEQVLGAQ